jgi:hypothetical protein
MSLGIPINKDGSKNWEAFKAMSGLEKKSDEVCAFQYHLTMKIARECIKEADTLKKASDAKALETNTYSKFNAKDHRIERGLDSISFDAAKRVIKRVEMMKRLRTQVLDHPQLRKNIAKASLKRWSGLPAWFVSLSLINRWNATHDLAFLEGISSNGFVRSDNLLESIYSLVINNIDPESAFYPLYQAHKEASLAEGLQPILTKDFWPTENVVNRRFEYLCDGILFAILNSLAIIDPESIDRKKTRVRKKKEVVAPVEGLLFQTGAAFGEESEEDMGQPDSKKQRLTSDDFLDPAADDSYYSTSTPASESTKDNSQDFLREDVLLAPIKYVPMEQARVELAPMKYYPMDQSRVSLAPMNDYPMVEAAPTTRVELAPYNSFSMDEVELAPAPVEAVAQESITLPPIPVYTPMVVLPPTNGQDQVYTPMDSQQRISPIQSFFSDLVRAAEENGGEEGGESGDVLR